MRREDGGDRAGFLGDRRKEERERGRKEIVRMEGVMLCV